MEYEKVVTKYHLWSRLFAWITIVISTLTLIGWEFDIKFFRSPLPGLVSMNPVTALMFLFSSASYLFLFPLQIPRIRKYAGKALALAVTTVCLLRLAEEFLGWQFKIDLLLYSQKIIEHRDLISNRMGVNSAIEFILIAVALLMLNFETKEKRMPAHYLALFISFVAIFSIVGYAYRIKIYYEYLSYIPMAIHTASCFLLMGLMLLFANPTKGLMREFTGPHSGSVTSRILIPATVIIPLVLGFLKLLGHWNGLYPSELGVAILMLCISGLFLILISYNAKLLNRRDIEIDTGKVELIKLNQSLESKIEIRTEQALQGEKLFRLVVESAPNALVLVNKEGRIELINSQTEKLFQYVRSELVGQQVEILMPQRYKSEHPQLRSSFFHQLQNGELSEDVDLFAAKKDGSEFPIEISLNPIESAEGDLVLASIIDTTERKLIEANRLKSDFLANMSHELRTPLNAILGFSELLIDKKIGPLNDKQLEYLHDVHGSGKHLLQLINNVLDFSKLESGKVQLHVESFDLNQVTSGVVKVLQPLAAKDEIKMTHRKTDEIENVRLDKKKYRQILFNLISNAIKFNKPGGEITISFSSTESDRFSLHVADTGCGIQKEDIKNLWIPFVQLDLGSNRKHDGTGLGLALTKNLVEIHGGKIEVKSVYGEGSTFTVTMPCQVEQIAD